MKRGVEIFYIGHKLFLFLKLVDDIKKSESIAVKKYGL